MSEKFENSQRPFAEELEQAPYNRRGKLFELKGHPHVVVRLDKWVNVSTKEKLAETMAKLKENKELFSSLEKDGMRVARMEYVIGGEKNEKGFAESYALVEKIDGKNLREIETFDTQAIQEVDQCYAGYFRHILRIVCEGGHYWSDMGLSQIAYGTRENEVEAHAYLVDVDPFVSFFMNDEGRKSDPPKAMSEVRSLIVCLEKRSNEIQLVENMAIGHASLSKARAKLKEIVEVVNPIIVELQHTLGLRHYDETRDIINKVERC